MCQHLEYFHDNMNDATDSKTCPSSKTSLAFLFRDISMSINGCHILHDISGDVNSGEILAIMGPSGSGKTTLLNALTGRAGITSGEITLDNIPMTKRQRKRTCYVLQEDCFLSNLTLWETLYFAAMIYLPESCPRRDKVERLENIIDMLELSKCRNTVVGNDMKRGLSGGEKKRLSIACELLKDPDVMVMDEPTSGLDSSTAFSLIKLLKRFSQQSGKAVVMSIHQPSSQMYYLFTNLLLLVDGHVAYFGDRRNVLSFFEELNLVCEANYNPADFILEVVKRDEETARKVIELANKKRCTDQWPVCLQHQHKCEVSNEVTLCFQQDSNDDKVAGYVAIDVEKNLTSQPELLWTNSVTSDSLSSYTQRWPTGFLMQFKMLNWRTFKQSKGRIISKYSILNSVTIAIVISLMWFQIPRTNHTIKDRMGFLFFLITYWTFTPILIAITSFPEERSVILKERASSAYRLSAYYCAKMSSELPLVLLLPILFVTLTYWMAGLGDTGRFFATISIVILHVINCQAIGYIFGALIWDLQLSITTATIYMLFSLLTAGFYTNQIPLWLTWMRYLSIIFYPYNAVSFLELQDLAPLQCSQVASLKLLTCVQSNSTTFVEQGVLFEHFGMLLPIHDYIFAITAQLIFFRILAYFAIKHMPKPN